MYVGFMYLTLQLSALRCDDTESRRFRRSKGRRGRWEMGAGSGKATSHQRRGRADEQFISQLFTVSPQYAWLKPLMPMPTNAGV